MRPDELDFRVATPVNVRSETDRDSMGNRVSSWIVRLPIGLADPLQQLDEVVLNTRSIKESKQALGAEVIASLVNAYRYEKLLESRARCPD